MKLRFIQQLTLLQLLVLQAALDPERDFVVPMAPELGLFLVESLFNGYNKKFDGSHTSL